MWKAKKKKNGWKFRRGKRKKITVIWRNKKKLLYKKKKKVKPTFVSELDQYVNIFSQFTIFYQESNQVIKSFTKSNKRNFFYLENNYSGEKQL